MKGHILTVVLVSVMAILSLPADDHWTETEPGGPLLASISPSDNQAVMLLSLIHISEPTRPY